MRETKATRLEALAEVVTVPPFMRVRRDEEISEGFLTSSVQYIVRGISACEDGMRSSHAGQFITIGPIDDVDVTKAVKRIFARKNAVEVVVQEFVDDVSGVAFCFARDKIYIEYAREHEAVTAGKASPFVALVPARQIEKYIKITTELQKIYDVFGPCDVEFVGITSPVFVQVRPITRTFSIDKEEVLCKMRLQEICAQDIEENEVSHTIAEHGKWDSVFSDAYCGAVRIFAREVLKKQVSDKMPCIVKIGVQYFIEKEYVDATRLSMWEIMRFLGYFARHNREIIDENHWQKLSPERLMVASYCIALADKILRTKKYFILREKIRKEIDRHLKDASYREDRIIRISYDGSPLVERVVHDKRTMTWKLYNTKNGAGVVVVEGDMSDGPFFIYRPGDHIPEGVVIVTEHLFAEIGPYLAKSRGVVCANGSINAHLAILARESQTPMKIQVPRSLYKKMAERAI